MQKLRMRTWSIGQLAYEVEPPAGPIWVVLLRAASLGRTGALVESAAVANIKSQIKRNRQNEAARTRNKSIRTALKTSAKKVHLAAYDGDLDAAEAQLLVASRQLDKAVSKGTLHKRTSARRKSRLVRSVQAATELVDE